MRVILQGLVEGAGPNPDTESVYRVKEDLRLVYVLKEYGSRQKTGN